MVTRNAVLYEHDNPRRMVLITSSLWLLGHTVSHHAAARLNSSHHTLPFRIIEELVRGFLLVLPVCTLLSHCTQRWMVRRRNNNWWKLRPAAASNWLPTLVFAVVGDLMVEVLLQPSLFCVAFSSDDDNFAAAAAASAVVVRKQDIISWGFVCGVPLAPQQREKFLLNLGPLSLLLGMIRFFFMLVGTYIGQGFMPIALTGSIATGMRATARWIPSSSTYV